MAGVLALSGVHFIFFGTGMADFRITTEIIPHLVSFFAVEVQEWAKTGTKGKDVPDDPLTGRELKPMKNGMANGRAMPIQAFQLPDLVKTTEIGTLLPEPAMKLNDGSQYACVRC